MIPLYGFLEGDTLGLLVLAAACSLRVWARGQRLEANVTVASSGLQALDRFDVRHDTEPRRP